MTNNNRGHISDTEKCFLEYIRQIEKKIDHTQMTIHDGIRIVERCHHLLEFTNEVKKSRDNWREKYYELFNRKKVEFNNDVKKSRDNWKKKYQELREKIKKEGMGL